MASSLDSKGEESQESVELCKFCLQRVAKYTCPRCGTPYCSLGCYRSEDHLDCSESFYQEWVEGELKGSKAAPDGKKRMMEILKKISTEEDPTFEELDSDDEVPLPDLSERLAGIDIEDSDAVWENLSGSEQAAFQDLLRTGDIASLIPNWEPWWYQEVEKSKKVIDLKEKSKFEDHLNEIRKKCPRIFSNIKPLSQITKIKPDRSVSFDLVNIIGGYTIAVRYFNGSHFDFPEEAATIIFNLSKSLASPQKFKSVQMALETVGLEALTYEGIEVTQDNVDLMKKDVNKIIKGPCFSDNKLFMLSVLSDLLRLYSLGGNESRKPTGMFIEMFPNADLDIQLIKRDEYKTTLKRLRFFLSWVLGFSQF